MSDQTLRQALEQSLGTLPVMMHDNGYPSQALPKAALMSLLALHADTSSAAVVHLLELGEGLTSCCGRTPFELPRSDRIGFDSSTATCNTAAPDRNDSHPVGKRSTPGIHHAERCPLRWGVGPASDCNCGVNA